MKLLADSHFEIKVIPDFSYPIGKMPIKEMEEVVKRLKQDICKAR